MTVTNVWAGAVNPGGARVVTKVSGSADVRLAVDTDPGMGAPVFFGPVTPTAELIASVEAVGLDPDTDYHFRIEHGGVLDPTFPGQFHTYPPISQPGTFTIGMATCAGGSPTDPGIGSVLASNRISNHPVFDAMREQALAQGWLSFIHGGDLHYYDLGSDNHGIVGGGSLANYRRGYDDVLTQTRQHEFYRNVPIVYMYDDHDWGPNNSGGSIPGRDNSLQVYRERVPHHPLAIPGTAEPNYHAFMIRRTLIVVLDCRSNADNNSSPAGPNKTMLGTAQKVWLEDLLATTSAEALVVVSTRQWEHPSGIDTWASFADERDELVGIFNAPQGDESKSWLGRMCILQGDAHTAGIRAQNPWGGFPVYQFAAIDSTPTAGDQTWKDVWSRERFQWGSLTVEDDGDTIVVTGTAYRFIAPDTTPLFSHSFQIDTSEPPGPPPPPPPPLPPPSPIATARVRTRVTWLGCRLSDGRIIAELPDITGKVSRVLGDVTTSGLTLPIPISGPAALPIGLVEQVTEPGRAMIAAVVNDIPTWAGIVGVSDGGTEATMDLPVASLEAYLDRRIVRDHQFNQVDEATIMATLAGDAGDIPGVGSGIGLEIDAPPTGTLRDRGYLLTDRKTVLDALQELMGVIDGPEWTIDLDWTDDTRTAIAKIFRVRKRIGVAAASPGAVFQTTANAVFGSRDGSEARYRFKIDYSDGHGANYVVAYSDGEGEDQPSSAPAIAQDLLDAGFPIYERHFQPSSDITTQSVLDDHAAAELERRRLGTRTFTIDARWDAYPRYGVNWQIGDDVTLSLVGHRHPAGIKGRGRVIGFKLDMQAQMIHPILEGDL